MARAPESADTVVVVPCYNEAARLDIAAFAEFADAHPAISFLFVDDGSSDDTRAVLMRASGQHPRLRSLLLPANVGKAEAVRAGAVKAMDAGPAYVGYWDADLATPLDVIPLMVELLEERSDLELILGSRVLLLGRTIRRRGVRHYLGRVFSTAVSLVTHIEVYDSQCGAKLMRTATGRTVFDTAFVTRWLFDVEILLRLRASSGSLDGAYEYVIPQWHDVPGSKVRRSDFVRAVVELMRLQRVYMRGRPVRESART